MKHLLFSFLGISFFLLFGNKTNAQNEGPPLKSASFSNQSLSEILDQLSDLYSVKIFYKNESQLQRQMDLSYQDKSLNEALDEVLSSTTLGYMDYRGYAKVIAPRLLLEQAYSSDFYQALEGSITDEGGQEALQIGSIENLRPTGLATLTGFILDGQNEEPIIGATVMIADLGQGTTTDLDGSYIIENVPAGLHELQVSFLGYEDYLQSIELQSDGQANVNLDKNAVQLSEVTIRARAADAGVNQVQIGVESMDIKDIEQLPTFLGEVDVIKSFLLQPGVSTVGEGASGFNVRGGDVDQNLILQDEAILFNSSHALGFFSTFNSDLIRKVDLYKANIPAQFGGRLVSVMDVEMRDGNFEKFKIKGGIGPISSKLAVEGPIVRDKVSFIGGFRSSYTDWLLQRLSNPELKKSSSFFYDGNLRITAKPNDKNTFIVSAYTSNDDFSYNDEFGFDYSTLFADFTYRLLLGDNMINTFSAVANKYKSTQFDLAGSDAARIDNNVSYLKMKNVLKFVPNDESEINVGASMINYFVDPGDRAPFGESSIISTISLEQEKGRESSVFGDISYVSLMHFRFLVE